MLAKYLTLTLWRNVEKTSSEGWIQYIIATVGLFLLGSLFWVVGNVSAANTTLAPFFITLFVGIGGWTGLRFISTHKPNGFYFLSHDIWLWSESAKGKLLSKLVALVTIVPYYTAKLTANYSIIGWILFILVLLVVSLSLVLFGEVIDVGIRRVSHSALLRLILIIFVAFICLTTVTSQIGWIQASEAKLFITPNVNLLLPTLLFFVGLSVVLAIILEFLFCITPISPSISPKYWSANRLVRIFRFTNRPVTEALLSSLLYLLRSIAFQRRLLAVLLLILAYPLLAIFFGIQTAQDNAVFAIILGFVVCIFYSIPVGKFSSDQAVVFAQLPQSKKLHPISELVATAAVIAVLAILFTNLLTPFPGAATAIIIVLTTVSTHIILFYSSYLAEQLKQLTTNRRENIILLGVVISFILSTVAINFLGVVTVPLTVILIILWTIVITWILVRVAYYLRSKQV